MHQPAGHLVHANQLTPGQRNALYRSCKQGQAIKLARGVYIKKGLWLELAQEANSSKLQAIARIAAHSHAYPDALAVGRSAALLHALPLQPFRPPKIVELGATNRSEYPHSRERRWRRISQSHLRGCEMVPTEFGLVRTAGILDTCIDLALWHALEDSVIAAESALNRSLISWNSWHDSEDSLPFRPGTPRARNAFTLVTRWSENPRESELKIRMWQADLPAPWQQATIFDAHNHILGRPDYLYHNGIAIEYDGQNKYGESVRDALRAFHNERIRESRIQAHGVFFIRVTAENFRDDTAIASIQNLKALLDQQAWAMNTTNSGRWAAAGKAWRE